MEQAPAAAQALERGRAPAWGQGAMPWQRAMRRCAPEVRQRVRLEMVGERARRAATMVAAEARRAARDARAVVAVLPEQAWAAEAAAAAVRDGEARVVATREGGERRRHGRLRRRSQRRRAAAGCRARGPAPADVAAQTVRAHQRTLPLARRAARGLQPPAAQGGRMHHADLSNCRKTPAACP